MLEKVALMGLAVGSASYTLTRAGVFEAVRSAAERRSRKLGELARCPYCLAHWLALALVLGTPAEGWLAMLVSWFATVGFAGVVHWVLLRAYEPIMKEAVEAKLRQLRERK